MNFKSLMGAVRSENYFYLFIFNSVLNRISKAM